MKKEIRSVTINITHMAVIAQNAEYTNTPGKRGYCKHDMAFAARTNGLSLQNFAKCAL